MKNNLWVFLLAFATGTNLGAQDKGLLLDLLQFETCSEQECPDQTGHAEESVTVSGMASGQYRNNDECKAKALEMARIGAERKTQTLCYDIRAKAKASVEGKPCKTDCKDLGVGGGDACQNQETAQSSAAEGESNWEAECKAFYEARRHLGYRPEEECKDRKTDRTPDCFATVTVKVSYDAVRVCEAPATGLCGPSPVATQPTGEIN